MHICDSNCYYWLTGIGGCSIHYTKQYCDDYLPTKEVNNMSIENTLNNDLFKPCPFCGSNVRIKKYTNNRFRAVCENYLCPVESFDYATEKEAIDWWNKRA